MSKDLPIAPGAHIQVRDAVWRVVQVNQTSSGRAAWHVVGLSEIVRDQDAIFLEEYEPQVRVLDPRDTQLLSDSSASRASIWRASCDGFRRPPRSPCSPARPRWT